LTNDADKTAQTILRRLGEKRAGTLAPDRYVLPLEELEALARDRVAASGSRTTLGQTGQIYVSVAAAREFALAERITAGDESARRELAELLIDAKPSPSDPDQWRMRSRSSSLDLTVRVAREGRLLIITHVAVRDVNMGRGRRG
jgi:hypothetical protein